MTRQLLPPTETVPSSEDLIARAEALREQLWADAPEADRTRRLTDAAVDAVTAAGLNRLMTPRRFGGYETDVRTVLDVSIQIGKGCGNSAWVNAVHNSGNFVVGMFPDQAREDVWGDNPDARTSMVLVAPSATVEPADGGLVVTGKWGFASGSLHAEWILVLAGQPDSQLLLIPLSDLTIDDTWHVAGMRGTGSNTVVADRVFVPQHRAVPYRPILDGQLPVVREDEPLYRTTLSGVLQVFLLGGMIGEASAALDFVLDKAPNRAIASSTYASQSDSVPFQVLVAEAAALIDTARLHATRAADTIDARRPLDVPTRARMRMDAAWTVQKCREAVDLLMTAHGTSAFAEFNPLQRIWRDLGVGSRHGGFGGQIPQEVYGKALLGLDPRQASYLL
ncbi:acyl-CoA dehydrogenase family protein [Kutzneria chonburiensis]|uniref:Acyl-CoA dehydrogenase family protein n=1 Tax=Kutzneria chonburiensis TaxID=1483604 RepID=A0ABV6N800_9PSEU|nr:acyl-CoA dehydrogenase family protein [Kutzneria chonburiensis]